MNWVLRYLCFRQGNADKIAKQLEGQLSELNAKYEQAARDILELNSQKSRSAAECAEHSRQLEEAESQVNQLTKAKQALTKQLEEAKAALEEESRLRAKLQGDVRNLQADLDHLKEQLEEEQEGRGDLQRALAKANNEVAIWRHKCESGEGGVRSEEMEEAKRKFNAKIQELEAQLEAAVAKASSLEKAKNRLQGELEDLTIEVERVRRTTTSHFTLPFLVLSVLQLPFYFVPYFLLLSYTMSCIHCLRVPFHPFFTRPCLVFYRFQCFPASTSVKLHLFALLTSPSLTSRFNSMSYFSKPAYPFPCLSITSLPNFITHLSILFLIYLLLLIGR